MDAAAVNADRRVFWATAVAVALTRWFALSKTLWDWDEALFALALRDYDVTLHHPHPPGFPLFIGAAKLIPLDAFHALQCVTFAASLFVFPAAYWLARELKMPPFAATAAGVLLAFFPNVWFYGGTAFSDVPSLVLVLVACALLLRGDVVAGAIVLAIACGFRPQNLLIGCVPALLAFKRRPRAALLGAAIATIIIIASYGTAARLSGGWDAYRDALAKHEHYIRQTDSFLSAIRPGLVQVADDFFVRPFRAPLINVVVCALALLGLVRRRWMPVAIFGPFLLFAWLFLDFHSASRFSIGYMPLFAFLAAEGIPARGRAITLGAVAALLTLWTWPALRIVHTTSSPPVAAIDAIRALHPKLVYVDKRLAAHADLLLPDVPRELVTVAPPLIEAPGAVLLREGASQNAKTFARERERLVGIARPRYFEVSVVIGRKPTA